MQNKEKNRHIEQPDEFSSLIREKLDDYKMSVDADIWDNIESRIAPQPRKKVWMRWVSSAAAVAAIMIIALLIIPDKKPLSDLANVYQNVDFTFPDKEFDQMIVEEQSMKPIGQSVAPIQYRQAVLASNVDEGTEHINVGNADAAKTVSDNLTENKQPESLPDKSVEEDKTPNQGKESDVAVRQAKQKAGSEPKLLLPEKKNNNNGWLLAASMSSTNGASSGINVLNSLKQSSYDPDYLSNSENEPVTLKDPGNANTEILSARDFDKIEHDVPLSFGITVRKDLNERIGLETGLVYTYLSSTMERTNIPQYKAKQELHYLGIPLNVVVYLWNDPKWNVYVSGGGMIEKGIRKKYVQDMYQTNNMTSSITDKGSVSGVQLSLGASVGASYAFYQNFSLYVEPRFSYYFDNDQPISVRTEKQSVFGVGGGLRYKF